MGKVRIDFLSNYLIIFLFIVKSASLYDA